MSTAPSSVQTLRVALRRIDLIDIAATRALQMLYAPGTSSKHSRETIPYFIIFLVLCGPDYRYR